MTIIGFLILLSYVAGFLWFGRFIIGFYLFSLDFVSDGVALAIVGTILGVFFSLFWPVIVPVYGISQWLSSHSDGFQTSLRKVFKEPKMFDRY